MGTGFTGVFPLVMLVLASGCAAPPPAPAVGPSEPTVSYDRSTGAVHGLVTDDEIVPLTGANVTLAGVGYARTDAVGRFGFNNVPPARYNLTAVAFGHQAMSKMVDVTTDSVLEVRFALPTLALDEGWMARSVFHGNLTLGTPTVAAFPQGVQEGVDKATFQYVIVPTSPGGEKTVCTELVIDLRPSSPTAVDMDLFLYNQTGHLLSQSASGSPREHIDYTKILPAQNLTILVHFWAGAATPFKVYVNATYLTGLAATLALNKERQ